MTKAHHNTPSNDPRIGERVDTAAQAICALHTEARGTGPDLRPQLIALGTIRQKDAPVAEAGDMCTAALAELAEAAARWLATDKLADACNPSDVELDAIAKVGGLIMQEATDVPAATHEALRRKAQILVRIEGPALRGDCSLTYAGQALLTSLLDDLTGGADDA